MSAPLRAKVAHFTDQGYQLRGVVHVGANDGEEIPWYIHMGHVPVLAIEPLPTAFGALAVRAVSIPGASGQVLLCPFALSDEPGTLRLHVDSRGTGKGSTAKAPIPHPDHEWTYEDVYQRDLLSVPVYRFDEWAASNTIDLGQYNTLVVDVEGMELEVLRGFGDTLDGFNFLNIECSERPVFDGQASAYEVEAYLRDRGFRRDSPIFSHDDVMYVREGLRP